MFTVAQPTFNTLNNCHLSVNELLVFDLTSYPVPSATNFTIMSNEVENFELNVFDLQGRYMQHGTIQNGTNELQAQSW
jgi:hypothetical protein